jgi:acyl CoA:acetate/3-ketoacid CoA transferase beta subunit
VSGGVRGGSLDSKNFYIDYGNYTNPIPLDYIKVLNDDGTLYDKKTSNVNSTSTETFLQKNKTTLMFFGALVVSYLVYKKLK